MVKGNPKSSATSATRKKHLKKHAPADEPPPKDKKLKIKGEKGKKKEPRVKVYIPPIKPAPTQPDPLETTGLAHTLPADLLVVLRNISKKAQVTKTRALEDLQTAWVNECLKQGPESLLVYTLVEMLPVWLHHVSSLFVNSSRRIRLLSVSLHSSLLQIPEVREQILVFFKDTATPSQLETILGTWCLATHDIERSVASTASKSWEETVYFTSTASPPSNGLVETLRISLNSFVQRTALDPNGVYTYLNPVPPLNPVPAPITAKGRSGKTTAASTPGKDGGDQTPRSKLDEQEESEQDRKARLRIGALGAARWLLDFTTTLTEDLQAFYPNPALWTILQSREHPSWINLESFGFSQPNVRKSGWNLLQSLLTKHKDQFDSLIHTIGTAVLRSAWVEMDATVQTVMWQPLLMFLKNFPISWTLEGNEKELEGDDDSDSDSDAELGKISSSVSVEKPPSRAYQEFLQFLQLGCSGSPLQGYPAVVVIISTIPTTLMTSLDDSSLPFSQFFSSFWAAIDGRALSSLHRVSASAAFLSSLLECVIFLLKRERNERLRSTEESSREGIAEALLQAQISRVWKELASKKLKVEERAAARLLAQNLESLLHIDQTLYDVAWDLFVLAIKTSALQEENAQLVSAVLKVLCDRCKEGTLYRKRAVRLTREVLECDLERCEEKLIDPSSDKKFSFDLLISLLDQFREDLFFDDNFADKLDLILSRNAFQLLSVVPSLLLSYLLHRRNDTSTLSVWHSLLSMFGSSPISENQDAFKRLLDFAHSGHLPKHLQPQAGEVDMVIRSLLQQALDGPVESLTMSLTRTTLLSSGYFLSKSAYNSFLQTITSTFSSNIDRFLNGDNAQIMVLDTAIDLIDSVSSDLFLKPEFVKSLMPSIFLFAYLLPVCTAGGHEIVYRTSAVSAETLWKRFLKQNDKELKEEVIDSLKNKLKLLLLDATSDSTPEDILRMLSQNPEGLQLDLLCDIFPSALQLDSSLATLSSDAIDPSLQILDPLIPPVSSSPSNHPEKSFSTDKRGFSIYARIINGLLQAFSEDRQLAKRNFWALRHFFSLWIYAQDIQTVPFAISRSPVFDDKVTLITLNGVIASAKNVSVYLLGSATREGVDSWRRVVLDCLLNGQSKTDSREGLSSLQSFLYDVVKSAKEHAKIRDSRVLKMVLERLFVDGIDIGEAEHWVQFAKKSEKTAPQMSMTIIASITATGVEPPLLDRYRNELASNLLGVKPREANTDGLLNLRKLVASAPDPSGEVVFLPPLRAVNVVKACQNWVLADTNDMEDEDELNEEVQSAMLPIFMHLAPILQNIAGSHWPFIFDVLEAVLESSTGRDKNESEDNTEIDESIALVGLARSLRLVILLEELAKTNKSLRAEWDERRIGTLTTIMDLGILVNKSSSLTSVPISTCRELVLLIVQNLPVSLIDQNTLPKLCHLIEDPSPPVQKMAYQLLKASARKRTEYFVIEVGVDMEDVIQATLPSELLEIVSKDVLDGFEAGEGGDQAQNLFGYLLGWMLIFDLFQDASFKVKSGYIEQLRNTNIVVDYLIPFFLSTLSLDRGGLVKAFKLDIWAVDRFYIDLYESGSLHAIPVFTAHAYYRALLTIPSLVHAWVLDCKDRQLTSAVTTYTSTHFSPVLIRAELEHIRSHAVSDGLSDDNMSVKVASSVNEVVAGYLVDEHQLEIKLKIPSDWPLHRIEVRDVKRVGVDENRWRAWVLGVQQTIWAHNGRVVDGLTLFKKNVTLHFEGQVECAICYSIISVMDGSLPKKPCKTCKNRFHAGCLYKWFNTSHSSSCPLCRSDII